MHKMPPELPPQKDIDEALAGFILSASGWRKVFAPSGGEEDGSRDLKPVDRVLVAAAGAVFSDFLMAETGSPVCALGMDTRPTGPAIASILAGILSARGVEVYYPGMLSAPEIMAYARGDNAVSSFIYITASHNPLGHNGFKFGLSDGGLLAGTRSARLITSFRELCSNRKKLAEAVLPGSPGGKEILGGLNAAIPRRKAEAEKAYHSLTRHIVSGSADPALQDRLFSSLKKQGGTVAGVADFNGSARALSIDRAILSEIGVNLYSINDVPGRIAHRIVPEGVSLIPCREQLERLYERDRRYIFGYMPDNDGDRGNLVYIDTLTGKALSLEAQEVFALSVLAELTSLRYMQDKCDASAPAAVVVNGPTSGRIERIAACLGASVFRCEVGEANVVELARQKRQEGFLVRILGEGSNGGNITHPSSVRDPLDTVFSLLKLLLLKDDPPLFREWCRISGQIDGYRDGFGVREILSSLPPFTTTSAYEDEAKIHIKTTDHAALKRAWENSFIRDWDRKKERFASHWNIASWEEVNYEGTQSRRGFGPGFRSGEEKGGLSMLLKDSAGETRAFLWMRGSGTEPVFRVLVDVEGDNRELHDELLNWHRDMVLRADSRVMG